MYLALRPPWGAGGTTPPRDAGVVAQAPSDAGAAKPKRRSHRHRHGGGAAGNVTSGDEQGWGSGDYTEETEPQLVQLDGCGSRARVARRRHLAPAAEDRHVGRCRGALARRRRDPVDDRPPVGAGPELRGPGRDEHRTSPATITVKLIVDGSGRVTKSKVQAFRYMFEHGLLGCVQRAVSRMKFPATGASTLVTMPINFN